MMCKIRRAICFAIVHRMDDRWRPSAPLKWEFHGGETSAVNIRCRPGPSWFARTSDLTQCYLLTIKNNLPTLHFGVEFQRMKSK